MSLDELLIRRGAVLLSALVYWGGVWIQARRVRRHTGVSPNIRPRGPKEHLLWLGWMIVVFGWIAVPLIVRPDSGMAWLQLHIPLMPAWTLIPGLLAVAGGYAGTLWCYAAMGDHWRIGVNRKEQNALVTRGPYGRIRHPIYSFQMLMIAGAAILLPSVLPLALLALHLVCVLIKARDEEAHLLAVHGDTYRAYLNRTGGLVPGPRPDEAP